jgi:hypothetical protein
MAVEIWSYREELADIDLTEFEVEAPDGKVGKVDEATYEEGSGSIIVDTGPWILGKKVMLPPIAIDRVDHDDERVVVDRTKDEIRNAPEFDEDRYRDDEYRSSLAAYYSGRAAR